ncbi:MAG: hypothetical protein U0414_06155 [Polyangiaceae bacterium]
MADTKNAALALVAAQGILAGCSSSGPAQPAVVEVTAAPRTEYPPAPSASGASAAPSASVHTALAKACCRSRNACKGLGLCKTDDHGCKGLNDCKGKGGCKPADCHEQVIDLDPSHKACCKGLNACAGKGECKTDEHGCKGLNQCKGHGGCAPPGC